jgi:hypothetical protein
VFIGNKSFFGRKINFIDFICFFFYNEFIKIVKKLSFYASFWKQFKPNFLKSKMSKKFSFFVNLVTSRGISLLRSRKK